MNIKEKAKAYDEALEKAKNYHSSETACNVKIAMENLFPELKESKGEQKPAQNYVYLVYCRDENNDYFCGIIIASDKEECIKLFRKNVGNYKFTATRLFETSLPSGIPFLNEHFEKFTIPEC